MPFILGRLNPLFIHCTIDFVLIFILFPFGAVLLSILISPLFIKMMIFFNKKVMKTYEIGYLDLEDDEKSKNPLKRSVVPFFFAFSLSFLLMPMLDNIIWMVTTGQTLSEMAIHTLPGTNLFILSFLLFILLSVSALVITFSWTAEDTHLVQYATFDGKQTPNLVGVGRWFSAGLKGFASISFIFGYYQMIYQYILYVPAMSAANTSPVLIIAYLLIPFDFLFLFIPIHLFYRMLFRRLNMKERLIKKLDVKQIEYKISMKNEEIGKNN